MPYNTLILPSVIEDVLTAKKSLDDVMVKINPELYQQIIADFKANKKIPPIILLIDDPTVPKEHASLFMHNVYNSFFEAVNPKQVQPFPKA